MAALKTTEGIRSQGKETKEKILWDAYRKIEKRDAEKMMFRSLFIVFSSACFTSCLFSYPSAFLSYDWHCSFLGCDWACNIVTGTISLIFLFAWYWCRLQLSLPNTNPDLPERAATLLNQAGDCLVATPADAVKHCRSSVSAMLNAKGLNTGSLYSRIAAACQQQTITKEITSWAHDIRLGSNGEGQLDQTASPPSQENAQNCINFTETLGQFLFVLPKRVEKGRADATKTRPPQGQA